MNARSKRPILDFVFVDPWLDSVVDELHAWPELWEQLQARMKNPAHRPAQRNPRLVEQAATLIYREIREANPSKSAKWTRDATASALLKHLPTETPAQIDAKRIRVAKINRELRDIIPPEKKRPR